MFIDRVFPFVHRDIGLLGNRALMNTDGTIDVSRIVFIVVPYDMDTGELGAF